MLLSTPTLFSYFIKSHPSDDKQWELHINYGDDNNTWNPPSPTLEHVMAIQGQLFETMVLMQQDHSMNAIHGQKNTVEKEEQ
jgi:hypothetical protein